MQTPPTWSDQLLCVWVRLVGFYSISTLIGYLMPNPDYTYILNIHDLLTCVEDNILITNLSRFLLRTVE